MNKDYYIINGELYHGGPGSGRKPDPNSQRQRELREAELRKHKTNTKGKLDRDQMTDKELKSYNERRENEAKFDKYNKTKSELEEAKDLANEGAEISRKLANQTRNVKTSRPRMDLSNMSNKEMRETIEREMLERQYNQMFSKPTKKEKAKETVAKIFEGVGATLAIAGSALGIALSIKGLKNKKG